MKRQPPEPKFRATCEWCGARQPRATTGWSVQKWMSEHTRTQHTQPPHDGTIRAEAEAT